MNQYEFIIALVFIVGAISILRSRLGVRHVAERPPGDGENDRLRGQVQQLQERIRVLERIVTDRGAETAAQIEALREHDRISEEDKA
jgi:hypothetical protein